MKNLKTVKILFLFVIFTLSCSRNNDNTGNCDVCDYTLTANEIAGTVDASISGVLNLTFTNAQASSPISNGTKGKFTILNNELTVEIEGEDCITIKNPISPGVGSSEVLFKDTCSNNLFYAVSVAPGGGLNEINLLGSNMSFYGQFKQ